MPARIEIKKVKEGEFHVRVIEGRSESTHRVKVTPDECRRLTGGKSSPTNS